MAAAEVKTDRNTKYLSNRYLVKELISNFGFGDFLAQFVSGEDVIAKTLAALQSNSGMPHVLKRTPCRSMAAYFFLTNRPI